LENFQSEYYRALNQIAKAIKLESEIKNNRFEEISRSIDRDFLKFLELTNGLDFVGQRFPISPRDLRNLKELWSLRSIFKKSLENIDNRIEYENMQLVIERIERDIALIYARCINVNRNLPDVIKSSLRTMRLDKKNRKSEEVTEI